MDFVESSTKFIETLLVEPCLGANDKLFLKFLELFFYGKPFTMKLDDNYLNPKVLILLL